MQNFADSFISGKTTIYSNKATLNMYKLNEKSMKSKYKMKAMEIILR